MHLLQRRRNMVYRVLYFWIWAAKFCWRSPKKWRHEFLTWSLNTNLFQLSVLHGPGVCKCMSTRSDQELTRVTAIHLWASFCIGYHHRFITVENYVMNANLSRPSAPWIGYLYWYRALINLRFACKSHRADDPFHSDLTVAKFVMLYRYQSSALQSKLN